MFQIKFIHRFISAYLKSISFLVFFPMLLAYVDGHAQSFNLQQLLKENKLISNHPVSPLNDNGKPAISSRGIVWLKNVDFSTGSIEIDLRGKDILQQSFIGVAFHGVDTITYDAIYFRPFNFRSNEPVRKIHAVQYISEPDFPWDRLREEKNGMYEKGIDPPPSAVEWFHARIVVDDLTINVYVNGATIPSLTVTKLNTRKDGLIGLWSEGVNGEFANMVIKK
ncbi:MAG: hypothetical protein ABI663_22210 [Chryseolinea sp.]